MRLFLLVLLLLCPTGLLAQSKATAAEKAREKVVRGLPVFTPEREAAALTFVRRHHGELAELLEQLQTSDQEQYEHAIRELFRTSEMMANLRQRDQLRYEYQLKDWVLNSRIQLLAAKLQMSRDASLAKQLEELLEAQAQLRIERMEAERQELLERAKRLEQAIERAQETKQAKVRRQLRHFLQHPKSKSNSESKAAP